MGDDTENSLLETVIFVTSSAAFPLLLMLSCILSVSPRFTSPKFSGSGKSVITAAGGVIPVPLRLTVAVGWFEALLVTVRVALLRPVDVG